MSLRRMYRQYMHITVRSKSESMLSFKCPSLMQAALWHDRDCGTKFRRTRSDSE